jgi:Rps23 Pro-64 3,4-dihydroxylase Tpa1-like proline 4-hydroxylase
MYHFKKDDVLFYKENKHLVIDQFLDNQLALSCQQEIINASSDNWDRYDNFFEQKYTYRDKNNLPENVNHLFKQLTSNEFINKLNHLTGLTLINDDDKIFWGVHLFNNSDKLDIHVDAGRHLKTGLVKAITLGIYLSYKWNEENGGHFEFWEGDKSNHPDPKIYKCNKKILPIFNRCIIFENNDTSWHGVPDPCICNNDEKRIFLTLSYLTTEKNNFQNERFKAYFIKRPNDPEDEEKDKMRILRSNPDTCKQIYNLNKK